MRTLWRIFAGFFKWTWRLLNFVRNLVMNIFFIFLVLVCAGIWMHLSSASQSQNSTRGALLLDITGVIVDKPSTSNRLGVIGRQLFGATSDRLQENSLFDIVDTIRQAKDDRNITGIVLDLKDFAGADQPSMQYIGKALREFRDSGKPVIAVGDSYTQGQYYLASFANKIWLSPQGTVDLHGFATNGLYYKSLLDKLKVTTHVFRVGTYKSAVEPFIRDDMSPAAREADSRWIGELWQNYLGTIAANRQMTPEQIFPARAACWTVCVRWMAIRRNTRSTTSWSIVWAPAPRLKKRSPNSSAGAKKTKTTAPSACMTTPRKNRTTAATALQWCLLTVPSWTVRKRRGTWAEIPLPRRSAMPASIRK